MADSDFLLAIRNSQLAIFTSDRQGTTVEEKGLVGDKGTAEFFDELEHVAAVDG